MKATPDNYETAIKVFSEELCEKLSETISQTFLEANSAWMIFKIFDPVEGLFQCTPVVWKVSP